MVGLSQIFNTSSGYRKLEMIKFVQKFFLQKK